MSEVCYQVDDIFFGNLFNMLFLRINNPEEDLFIYLISPWIHDLSFTDEYRETLISYSFPFPNSEFQKLNNISSIFNFMKTKVDYPEKFDLKIITSEYNSVSINKSNPRMNKREQIFLNKILTCGGEIYLHPDLHSKMILNPGKIMDGSANITFPGFFFHTENVSLYNCCDENFKLKLKRANDILEEAIRYKDLQQVKNDFSKFKLM